MKLTFQDNLDEWNAAFREYSGLVRMSVQEAMAKKGSDFAFRLFSKLRKLSPKKGNIRTERLAALATGQGLRVRPSAIDYARQKTIATGTNIKTRKDAVFFEKGRTGKVKSKARSFWKVAVDRELSYRESGRGFLALSSRYKSLGVELEAARFAEKKQTIYDRYGRFLGAVGFKPTPDDSSMTFRWGGNTSSGNVARTLQRPKPRAAIADALDESRRDMLEYVARKHAQAAARLPR